MRPFLDEEDEALVADMTRVPAGASLLITVVKIFQLLFVVAFDSFCVGTVLGIFLGSLAWLFGHESSQDVAFKTFLVTGALTGLASLTYRCWCRYQGR